MLPACFDRFQTIWVVDDEFTPREGALPVPVCLVAHEVRSGRRLAVWEDELRQRPTPPYDIGRSSLFVSFVAPAELSCHLALGWSLPAYVLDLSAEFRGAVNGMELAHGKSLLGALAHYNLEAMGAGEKAYWQELAQRGGPWTSEEREGLLHYCAEDVEAEVRLFHHLAPRLCLSQALLRGHYTKVVAHVEATGIPLDLPLYTTILALQERAAENLL
jgi:hypothetical protein